MFLLNTIGNQLSFIVRPNQNQSILACKLLKTLDFYPLKALKIKTIIYFYLIILYHSYFSCLVDLLYLDFTYSFVIILFQKFSKQMGKM